MLTVYKDKISFRQQKMSPCKDCKSTHIIALLPLDYFSNCSDHAHDYGYLQGCLIKILSFWPYPGCKTFSCSSTCTSHLLVKSSVWKGGIRETFLVGGDVRVTYIPSLNLKTPFFHVFGTTTSLLIFYDFTALVFIAVAVSVLLAQDGLY